MPNDVTIRPATEADLDQVRAMLREYHARFAPDPDFHPFEAEIAALPGDYAPPAGRLLIALVDGRAAGVVALRPLAPGVCEMKRLFVRGGFHGRGLGRQLMVRLLEEARGAGYDTMRLDTIPDRMPAAVALYEAFAFRQIEAYNGEPIPRVRYFERALDLA